MKFPSFNRDSIIHRIKSTAYSDTYSTALFGSVPNNVAGWGKADAFKALTGIGTDLTAACSERIICKIVVPILISPPLINNVKIYPNPSNGTVFIKYTSVNQLQLSVYNTLGQLAYTTNLPAATNSQIRTLQLSHLAQGIYFFRCTGTNYVTTHFILTTK